MIEVILDNQLGYCCCMGVLQEWVMSTNVQARSTRSRMHIFSGRDSCPQWVFKGNPLKLDMRPSGSDCGKPMKLDWNMGHSWADCGHFHCDWLWHRDFLFRGWGWVRS